MELLNVFASCIYIFKCLFLLISFFFFSEMYSIYNISYGGSTSWHRTLGLGSLI